MKPTQEQVIVWAREAGIPDANIPLIAVGRLETGAELLLAVAALAYEAGRKDENKACAEEAGYYAANSGTARNILDAIRARREQ